MEAKSNKTTNIVASILLFFLVIKYYSKILFNDMTIELGKISMGITLILAFTLIIYDLRKLNIIHFIILGIFFIQYRFTDNVSSMYVYTLGLSLWNRDLKKIFRTYIATNLILFIVCLGLNYVGIRPSEYIAGRDSLGFRNPNGAYMAFFIIWLTYVYVKFGKINKLDWFIILFSPIAIYSETRTRTGFITVLIGIGLIYIFNKIDIDKRIYKFGFAMYPMILTISSLVLTYGFYDDYWINEYLSHRPYYWHKYLTHKTYGLNFIGYTDDIKGVVFKPMEPLDSGYIWTMYSGGIIVFIIILILYTYAIYSLCYENKKAEVLLIVSTLTYAFAESVLLDLAINLSFIFIPYAVHKLYVKMEK